MSNNHAAPRSRWLLIESVQNHRDRFQKVRAGCRCKTGCCFSSSCSKLRAFKHSALLGGLLALHATGAPAEVAISGEAGAMQLDARREPLGEVLAALNKTYEFRYRLPPGLDRPISGSYAGSLRDVLSLLLQDYNFVIDSSGEELVVTIYDRNGSTGVPIRAASGGEELHVAPRTSHGHPFERRNAPSQQRPTHLLNAARAHQSRLPE